MSTESIVFKIQKVVQCRACRHMDHKDAQNCEVCGGEQLEYLDSTLTLQELVRYILKKLSD